tara:strand:- start:310 stop:525 length:216 start_codon:yes stop_codon:yes gene_type:complete
MASIRKVGKSHFVRYTIGKKHFTEKIGRNLSEKVAFELYQRVEERLARQKQDRIDKELGIDYRKLYLNMIQ